VITNAAPCSLDISRSVTEIAGFISAGSTKAFCSPVKIGLLNTKRIRIQRILDLGPIFVVRACSSTPIWLASIRLPWVRGYPHLIRYGNMSRPEVLRQQYGPVSARWRNCRQNSKRCQAGWYSGRTAWLRSNSPLIWQQERPLGKIPEGLPGAVIE